ncbi:MAG: tetratricopeptide repeat protein [bacterium]
MAKESPGESELRDQLAQTATPAERCDVLLVAFDAAPDRHAPHWEELLRVALAEAQSLDDPDRVCRVCVKLCNYFARLGRGVDTDRTLGLFADSASRTQDRRLKGSCAYVKAGRLHDLDQYQQAEPFVAECIEHWTVIGYTAGLSAIHDLVGSAALMRGQPAEALRSYQQSLEYVPAGDLYGRAIANCNIAGALQQMGRWEDAVESAYHGLALAEQGGLPEQRAQSLELLGEVFLRRDRLPKAIDLFSQVIRIHGETGLAGDQARDSVLALAEAYLRQGDLSRAEQVLTEHESLILADARPYCRARLLTARAEVSLAEGRVPDAEALARESAELTAGHGLVSEQAEALRVLARARAAAGNGTAAREGLEQAAALLGAREDSFELARVRMQHGLLLVDTGETAAGRELLQAAGRTFRRLSATAESGQVSRALFGLDLAADSELALLQGVTGLVALGLDPQVFVTRAIELLLAGLRFSSGTLLVGRRPVVVVGAPNLEEARLAADAAETVRTPLALVLPVPFQGRSLGVLYLDRPEPVEGGRQLMILDTLATLLAPMVQRVAEITASAANAAAQTAALAGLHYTGVVGSSPAMRDVLAVVARVAGTSVPVLIRGESGTGKELVARALHESSPRA